MAPQMKFLGGRTNFFKELFREKELGLGTTGFLKGHSEKSVTPPKLSFVGHKY